MQIGVLHEFEYISRITIVMEFYAKLAVDMPETPHASILSRCYYTSGFKPLGLSPADVLRIVKFVGSPVLERAVCMDA